MFGFIYGNKKYEFKKFRLISVCIAAGKSSSYSHTMHKKSWPILFGSFRLVIAISQSFLVAVTVLIVHILDMCLLQKIHTLCINATRMVTVVERTQQILWQSVKLISSITVLKIEWCSKLQLFSSCTLFDFTFSRLAIFDWRSVRTTLLSKCSRHIYSGKWKSSCS